jgi:RNA polymerase sigma-70 factor, ECF subfamily
MARFSNRMRVAEIPDNSRRSSQSRASKNRTEEALGREVDGLLRLVRACKQGDRAAQRELYDACHPIIFRLAARMVGVQDALDVMQQVFLQAFRSLDQFEERSQFETWLYRLCVNESLQHLRRIRSRPSYPLKQEPIAAERHEKEIDQRDLLEKALMRIDVGLRTTFLLREVEGLSYHEIADAMQIPEGTVGSRLNRARGELQQRLTELGY